MSSFAEPYRLIGQLQWGKLRVEADAASNDDTTYIWAQGKWHYMAVVLDLCARRVVGWALSVKPDADLVFKALDMAYEQRGRPQGLLFHLDQGSPVCESFISPAAVELSNAPEHESPGKLLGQRADGARVPQLDN